MTKTKEQISKNTMGMTPKQIVAELDRFIIGQTDAKKAVAKYIAEVFCHTHNTLQQSLASLMFQVIKEIAAIASLMPLRCPL